MQIIKHQNINDFTALLQSKSTSHQWIDSDYWQSGFCVINNDAITGYAVLYHNPLQSIEGKPVACLGNFFAMDASTSQLLFDAVCEQATTFAPQIIGPINGSTWATYRCVVGELVEPFFMEPNTPNSYNNYFIDADFEQLKQYYSAIVTADEEGKFPARYMGNSGFTFRNFDTSNFDAEIETIYKISCEAFTNNFLYTPIPFSKFYGLYYPLKEKINTDFFIIAMDENGTPVGYVFGYPDFAQPQNNRVVLKTLARLPQEKYNGVGTFLTAAFAKAAMKHGFTGLIHALMIADDTSLRMSKLFGANVFRNYVLYRKQLL